MDLASCNYVGADEVSAIANQESLSILEVEMRKLEAVVKEIVGELGYLQRREMRMRDTNGKLCISLTRQPLRRPSRHVN